MKQIILVRHSKAEDRSLQQTDFQRNIIERGEKDAAKKALQLLKLEPTIDLIISSDAPRALQTAEIFAKTYKIETNKIQSEHYLYNDYEPSDLLHTVNQIDNNCHTIAIFGHNPNIAYTAVAFCAQRITEFPTSSVAVINFEVDTWAEVSLGTGFLVHLLNK